MSFDLFCSSVQGASHIRKGMPCEDFGLKDKNDFSSVFVVADGHGDSNCPRSAVGSKFICEIARNELMQFATDMKATGWNKKLFDAAESEGILRQLITCIFGKWTCAVNEHYDSTPLTDQEKTEASKYLDRYLKGQYIEHIYGTTLICGLLTDEYLILLQQGDGRCCVFDADGHVSQPIPSDDRCLANVTTSVCDRDAITSCRYHIIDMKQQPVAACIVGTDGVEDSFSSMDMMHVYYRQLLEYASTHGAEGLEHYLADTLPEFSATGSGDDTTICGFFNEEMIATLIDVFQIENEAVRLQNVVSSADEHIKSMSAKLAYLKSKYDTAVEKYMEVENRHKETADKLAEITGDKPSEVPCTCAKSSENTGSASSDSSEVTDSTEWQPSENPVTPLQESSEGHDPANRECVTPSVQKLSPEQQKKLDVLSLKAEQLAAELCKASAEKTQIEEEYLPYQKKYDDYISAKEAALRKMKELVKS